MYGDFQNFRNFNSHAHVERDKISLSPTSVQKISTHTLTWSVTNSDVINIEIPDISTHTLTWSVTFLWCRFKTPKGISTHTLTWSVTLIAVFTQAMFFNFNSHAHVERDLYIARRTLSQIFQLTRSRGA